MTASKDQNIWTRREYENLVLDLEFKTGPNANSGVIVYCSDTKNWVPGAVEIQILDDFGPKWAKVDETCLHVQPSLTGRRFEPQAPGRGSKRPGMVLPQDEQHPCASISQVPSV